MVNTIGIKRLINQWVHLPKQDASIADVVRHMGAMQAQDYNQCVWAIGSRIPSSTSSEVEKAFAEKQVIRTWTMRGTIHAIVPEDARLFLDLCASRILKGHGRRMQQLELTEKIMRQCADLIHAKIADNDGITRTEIMQLLEQNNITTDGQRGYHILWHLAHQGILYISAQDGREQWFSLLDKLNVPPCPPRDEALANLIERYFTSHAPATEHDFARWTGLTLTDTRKGIASLGNKIRADIIDDVTYYSIPSHDNLPSSLHLLAAFDEFLLGYKDRDAVLPPEHAQKVVPGNNGVFQPLIVLDGQVIGVWKRKIKSNAVDIEVHPFDTLDKMTTQQIEAQADVYSQFMGLPINLAFG